jgi:hypothetical protein
LYSLRNRPEKLADGSLICLFLKLWHRTFKYYGKSIIIDNQLNGQLMSNHTVQWNINSEHMLVILFWWLGSFPEKLADGSLICLFLKLVQINFIFIDNVRILYIYFHFVILTCSIYCIYFKNDFNIIEMSSYLWLNHDISVTSNLSDLNKKNRNKRHSSPFINVVKGVFFVVRVTLVPVPYLSASSAVHSYDFALNFN